MGLIKNYTNQFYHGERIISSTIGNVMESIDDNELFGVEEEDDNLVETINDIEEDFVRKPEQFNQLLNDAEKPLYPCCKKVTKM